jgi:membrane-associated phospholipid phosphatase
MNYQAMHNYVLSHPKLKALVVFTAKVLPMVVYLCYPLTLLYLLVTGSSELLRGILVPAVGFLVVTVLRAKLNASRPYEVLGIPAITPKDTVGKSFPSRHAACGAVIAVTVLYLLPPLGVFLLVVSLLIPASRVLAGVHFLKDVVAGWLLGALIGFVGMYLL